MDNVVIITNTKSNEIEFDIDIQGLETEDMVVRFVIQTSEVLFAFPCRKEDKKWVVTIPKLSYLEQTAFPFFIEVMTDGYYFEAIRGTVNVVGSPELYTSAPKNKAMAPNSEDEEMYPESTVTEKKKPVIEVPKTDPLRTSEMSIAQIAENLMKTKGGMLTEDSKKKAKKSTDKSKDQRVRDIIREGKKNKKKTAPSRLKKLGLFNR